MKQKSVATNSDEKLNISLSADKIALNFKNLTMSVNEMTSMDISHFTLKHGHKFLNPEDLMS